jgi:hypothetical protein
MVGDPATGVASGEQPVISLTCRIVEPFVCHNQQPAGSRSRVGLASECVFQHPAALIEPVVGAPYNMDRNGTGREQIDVPTASQHADGFPQLSQSSLAYEEPFPTSCEPLGSRRMPRISRAVD